MASSALPPSDHWLPFASTSNVSSPAAGVKRKTPSELRQEQLDRVLRLRNSQDGTITSLPSVGWILFTSDQDYFSLRYYSRQRGRTGSWTGQQKKTYSLLVDTYAPKSSDRPKAPFLKAKDDFDKAFPNGNFEACRALRSPREESCSLATAKDVHSADFGHSAATKIQGGNFRDVTELSSETKPQASGLGLDMVEALKVMGFATQKSFSGITVGSGADRRFPVSSSHIHKPVPDKLKSPPIDLSLKLSARFLSEDSLHWCHGVTAADEVEGVKLFPKNFERDDKLDLCCQPDFLAENGTLDRFGVRFCQALYSWVHPSPHYLELYETALRSAHGDTKNVGIITKIFQTWEDSFRSLYYMFRHQHCNIFYICTQQSVVMFEQAKSAEGKKTGSHVYWSRSTPGLRKKLQEQGVEFIMPLQSSDGNFSALEDLHELTELEKLNPGHTRLMDASAAVHESQSLLCFDVDNVHRLFDFLLNYRFLVPSGSTSDLPVLYSPVTFKNSSLYAPEIKCRSVPCPIESVFKEEATRNDRIIHKNDNIAAVLYSLELKGPPGAYITPWVIQAVHEVLQKSQKLGFEVSYITEPLSENLNAAQNTLSTFKEVDGEESKASSLSTIYPTAVSMSKMRLVKRLRYTEGFYQSDMAGPS